MERKPLNIMTAQLNPKRGACDIAGNAKRLADLWVEADEKGVDLVVTPEQSLTGYPLEDMAAQPDVLWASRVALNRLIDFSKTRKAGMVIGLPEKENGHVYNTVYLIERGKIVGKVRKTDLPNEDVFDEKRIYTAGTGNAPVEFRGHKLGIMICEDAWHPTVAKSLWEQGAEALIVPNASPWHEGKHHVRVKDVLRARVAETGLPILYVNQVGGMDELVFDGHSMAMNGDGKLEMVAKGFAEDYPVIALKTKEGEPARFTGGSVTPFYSDMQMAWQALVLGTRDYVEKNGFKRTHLGKSGGIDSAVVAAILVDALGADKVDMYKLPSEYTQSDSNDDADEAARLLGTNIEEIPIGNIVNAVMDSVKDHFRTNRDDATNANIQARARGMILMALSNRNDSLLITTGNKSEMAVGWATLYGDMNGGFNPLKGVKKMQVYALAEWRNKHYPDNVLGPNGRAIVQNTIDKKAKAELGPGNNFDEDVLAPYPILDDISKRYVEENQSVEQICEETGYNMRYVEDTLNRTDWSEFKRRQSCPGLKITKRDFGKGYRVPITKPTTIRMIKAVNELKL